MRFIKIESDRVTIVDQAIEDSGVGPYTVEESESGVCIGFVTSDPSTQKRWPWANRLNTKAGA